MSDIGKEQEIDFTVDQNNLFREESITDMKVASIRRLVPVKADGTDDTDRKPMFIGHTQLMSPEGAIPIQSKLEATTLKDALTEFPNAMERALAEVIEKIKNMRQQQQPQQGGDSRIIMPGR